MDNKEQRDVNRINVSPPTGSAGVGECRIYRMGKGRKMVIWILMIAIAAVFAFLAYLPFTPGMNNDWSDTLIMLAGFGGGGVMILIAFYAVTVRRVEVDSREIRSVGLFRKRRMALDEITGFRIRQVKHQKFLILQSGAGKGRKMSVSLNLEDEQYLRAWARDHFPDSDAVDYQTDLKEIFENEEIGQSPEEKGAFLKRARYCCHALTGVTIPVGVWGMFFPKPYLPAMISLAVLPVISLIAVIPSKGVIKLFAKLNGAFPTVGVSFMVPCILLALRALLDWNVLDWRPFWEPFAVSSALSLVFAIFCAPEMRTKLKFALMGAAFCLLYGWGITLLINGFMGDSKFVAYEVTVADKHSDSGEDPTYYLTLTPWGPRTGNQDVTVDESTYNQYAEGSTATVLVRAGKLGISYYFVR